MDEWLVGVPELQNRTFTLDEVKDLIQRKQILETDLVLRKGDVWKIAKDIPELMPCFGLKPPEEPRPGGPAKRTTDPQRLKKTATQPPARKTSTARAAVAEAARQRLAEAARRSKLRQTTKSVPAAAQPPPAPEKLIEPPPVQPPKVLPLELDGFTFEDLLRRIRLVASPMKLLMCLVLIPLATAAGLAIDVFGLNVAGVLFASLVFVIGFAVLMALVTFRTRCELEGVGGWSLMLAYLKNAPTLVLLGAGSFVLLAGPAFIFVLSMNVSSALGRQLLRYAGGLVWFVLYLVFILTIGYLAASLAVDAKGIKVGLAQMRKLYRFAFRRMLGHSMTICLVSYSLFWVLFSPTLMSLAEQGSTVNWIYASLMFGAASVAVTMVLGTTVVLSYVYLMKNTSFEDVTAELERGPQSKPPVDEDTEPELPAMNEPPPPPSGGGR